MPGLILIDQQGNGDRTQFIDSSACTRYAATLDLAADLGQLAPNGIRVRQFESRVSDR